MAEHQEVFENEIEMWLNDYCVKYDIENLRTESQNVWNGALMHVGKNLFKGSSLLKSTVRHPANGGATTSTYNAYDISKVTELVEVYISLCAAYDKEVTQMGFSKFSAIDLDTLQAWGRDEGKLSSSSSLITKRLKSEREESLSAKLAGGKVNPVGILAILNHHYQWNLPGVSKEPARIQSRSPEEIAAQYGAKLSDNSIVEALPEMPD